MLKSRPQLTKEIINSKITDDKIFEKYCTNWLTVGYSFNKNFIAESAFRADDENPSARITVSSTGTIYYIDYGEGESRTAIRFVMDKYGLQYQEALEKIWNECDKKISDREISKYKHTLTKKIEKYKHTTTTIKIKSRPFNNADLTYWESYGWTPEFLKEAKIVPITSYWINSKKFDCGFEEVYCFNYYEHDGIFRRKLYFPHRDVNRFISNIDTTVVQGWNLLPKEGGDLLIITKAYKDIGTFKAIKEYAIATNNETSFIPEHVLDKLKSRWEYLIIWWDNDKEGIKSGNKFSEMYDIPFFHTPFNTEKDPSDYYKTFGKEKFEEMFNEQLIFL